jgi:hypothetical protein
LEQKLGWMFSDQVALWKPFKEVSQERLGDSKMQLEQHEAIGFVQYCGLEFQGTISWDFCRFFSSFLRLPTAQTTIFPNTWTPILSRLKSQLSEIQQWAEVTEQLLKVFEYSNLVLGRSSVSPPGGKLPDKWFCCWKNFCDVVDRSSRAFSSQPIEANCQWD